MVTKQTIIQTEARIQDFGSEIQVKVELNQQTGMDISMALFLLKEDLVEAVGMKFSNFLILLKKSKDNYSYVDSLVLDTNVFKGRISNHGLDYILHYILRFYRDQIAESEHIDVDFMGDKMRDFILTISCSNFMEYSEEETRKRLSDLP